MLMYPILRPMLLLVLMLPVAVQAVTLGEARVNSYLNQPLDAEIDLIGLAPGQHEDLRLRIANDEQLERLGIVYDRFLSDMYFDVVRSDDQWLVRARSRRPVSEPFLDFAVHMSWPGGQLVRQYTLLLDPPYTVRPARAASVRRDVPVATAQPGIAVADSGGTYGPVRNGETLWPIAKKLKPGGITTQQMAMALLRANPEAFIDGNVNKLRAGATLTIPPRAFIEALDAAAAGAEFAAQTRRWQAPPVATSPRAFEGLAATPPEIGEQVPEDAGAVATEQVPQEEVEDQLRILSEQEASDRPVEIAEEDLAKQLLVTMEAIESNRLQASELEERLLALESELESMEQTVRLKDAQIAALQSEISLRQAVQAATPPAESASDTPPSTVTSPMNAADTEQVAADMAAPPAVERTVNIAGDAPLNAAAVSSTDEPWYEQYLWVVWAVLGLLGLIALALMLRRPEDAAVGTLAAELPALKAGAAPRVPDTVVTESAALKKAEEDFRKLAREKLSQPVDTGLDLEELSEFELLAGVSGGGGLPEGTGHRLPDDIDAGHKRLDARSEPNASATMFSNDDIDSWVRELGVELEQTEKGLAENEQLVDGNDADSPLTASKDPSVLRGSMDGPRPADIDLEPIGEADVDRLAANGEAREVLAELEDQLAPVDTSALPHTANVEQIDDNFAEQAFSMSLDLARAYLEIGDQEGAKDMLEQALDGAHDPDHQRQIKEMLRQIG